MTALPNLSVPESLGHPVAEIPVRINLDIIGLFSEGLYKSPHKAVEELVTNAYDADAKSVHVLLPESSEHAAAVASHLWVIDDGHGMDADEFHQLWRVADSKKGAVTSRNRKPIGQFGIGKLAAYVLAWRLRHISLRDGKYLITTMDFRRVVGRQSDDSDPVVVTLRELEEGEAKETLAEIERRDAAAWSLLFGPSSEPNWTVAALGHFKDLYSKLHAGRLRWVLRTGLPLHSNFKIYVDGMRLESSKEQIPVIRSFNFSREIAGIGEISGTASVHTKQLTHGKSEEVGRSNGYFVRVRRRVINLYDGLFGTEQPNYAAWSRFSLLVDADGLQQYLLSSREGVRETDAVRSFRDYLVEQFNRCRQAFDEWNRGQNDDLDLAALLDTNLNSHIAEPLISHVREVLRTKRESFYVDAPTDVSFTDDDVQKYDDAIRKRPVARIVFCEEGRHAAAIRYEPVDRRLCVNNDHPFIDKITRGHKGRFAAELFATSELVLEGQLRDRQIEVAVVASLLADRDRGLRIVAGETPTTAAEVLRRLDAAESHTLALERAVGEVFRALGFEYERRGGSAPGPDGSLWARLGRIGAVVADYRLVYDAKTTGEPRVPAARIDLASLEEVRERENATYAFFVARGYAAQESQEGAINRRVGTGAGEKITLLTLSHLRRLIEVHFQYGVTLVELEGLFKKCRTPVQVDAWMEQLQSDRKAGPEVPVAEILAALEREREDELAVPNIVAARAMRPDWRQFEPERLRMRLKAVEQVVGRQWMEVEDNGNVIMRHTAREILAQFERSAGVLMPDTSGKR